MKKKETAAKDKQRGKQKKGGKGGGGGGGNLGKGGMHSVVISSAEERRRKALADAKLPKTNQRTVIRNPDGSLTFIYPPNYQNDNDSQFNGTDDGYDSQGSNRSDGSYHSQDIW